MKTNFRVLLRKTFIELNKILVGSTKYFSYYISDPLFTDSNLEENEQNTFNKTIFIGF